MNRVPVNCSIATVLSMSDYLLCFSYAINAAFSFFTAFHLAFQFIMGTVYFDDF